MALLRKETLQLKARCSQDLSLTYSRTLQGSFSAKEPPIIGLFCGKWRRKMGHPMYLLLARFLSHTLTHWRKSASVRACEMCECVGDTATHCNTLQHTATHCNTLQHTAAYCNKLPVCVRVRCVSVSEMRLSCVSLSLRVVWVYYWELCECIIESCVSLLLRACAQLVWLCLHVYVSMCLCV